MDRLSGALEAREFEVVRRGGYDPAQVDAFMARIAREAFELEKELAVAHGKIHGLERRVEESRDAEQAVGVAFLAAADAKHNLIEDASKRAEEILERARREAASLDEPRRQLEARERAAAALLAEVEQARASADAEADQLLAAARRQAERIVAEARSDALAAIEESRKEAEDWIQQTKAEHQRVVLMLRGLKAAVRDMLDGAARSSDPIRVVLAETAQPAPTSVELPT